MPSLDSLFDSYASLSVKHGKLILVAWILIIALLLPFALDSNRIVSYTINVPSSNNQSQVAERMVSSQFSSYQSPQDTYYVILQGSNVLAPEFYLKYLQLNQSLSQALSPSGLENITSVYSLEYSLLSQIYSGANSTLMPVEMLLNQTGLGIQEAEENLSQANSALYTIYHQAVSAAANVANVSQQLNESNLYLYSLRGQVNQSAFLVFGLPAGFLQTWVEVYNTSGGYMTVSQVNSAANSTFVQNSQPLLNSTQSIDYYDLFYQNWYSDTSGSTPSSIANNIYSYGSKAVNQTAQSFALNLNQSESSLFSWVQSNMNLTDYDQASTLDNVTLGFATLGMTPAEQSFLKMSYQLGPNPSAQALNALALTLATEGLAPAQSDFVKESFTASLNSSIPEFAQLYFVNQTLASNPGLGMYLADLYNISLQNFAAISFSVGENPSHSVLDNASRELVSSAISSNSTLKNQVELDFNESVAQFVLQADSAMTSPGGLEQEAVNLTTTSLAVEVSRTQYLDYNFSSLLSFVRGVQNGTYSSTESPSVLLSSMPFRSLPVTPGPGLLGQFVSPGGNTTVVLVVFSTPPTDSTKLSFEHVVDSFNSPSFITHYTATQILDDDVRTVISDSETVALPFGIIVALLVAGIFFLSPVAALLPMVIFGVSLETGFGLVDLILGRLQGQTLSYISPIIIAVLGLGLASDYAVLLLNRFRQESQAGKVVAATTATRWAGEAVFTSALTVIISYLALSLSGIPLFSDVGSANVIVVGAILAASLTLLPALMVTLGPSLFWPNRHYSNRPSRLSVLTKKSIARPKLVVGLLVVITLFSLLLSLTLPVNINFLSLAPDTPAKNGLDQITQNFGGSSLLPEYVVVQLPSPLRDENYSFNLSELSFLSQVSQTIRSQSGVAALYGVLSPYNETLSYQSINSMPQDQRVALAELMQQYLNDGRTSVYFKVVLQGDPFGNAALQDAIHMSDSLAPLSQGGYSIYVGGTSTDAYGILNYVFQVLPKIIAVLVLAIFVVLLVQLKSVFTPLRLIATILSSVTWTLALVWVIFYGFSGLSIYVFAPLFLITTMLGVGMDYDIFLITRVREEVVKGAGDDQALVTTSETTGGVITVLGLILGSVFFGLVLTQVKLLQQIGLTLTLGVLLDTFVVWLMFVPAIMTLAKRFNWWPGNPRRERRSANSNQRA
jgi:RND superfamily putative drug exporter